MSARDFYILVLRLRTLTRPFFRVYAGLGNVHSYKFVIPLNAPVGNPSAIQCPSVPLAGSQWSASAAVRTTILHDSQEISRSTRPWQLDASTIGTMSYGCELCVSVTS